MVHRADKEPIMSTTVETRKDARSRAVRTITQGIISVVLVAVAGVVADQVTPGQVVDYAALGAAVGTAVVTAVASYVHRLLSGEGLDRVQGDHT